MTDYNLFQPYSLGDLQLANRVVMSPLTRNRAGAGLVPTEMMAEYYAQRADAGVIISEATQISRQGQGYQDTPGIYTPEQIDGWRKVTDAVHAKGGRMIAQLWHVGRVSHVDLQEGGAAPVAPSAIQPNAQTFVNNGFAPVSPPRALELDEIPGIVEEYRQAAANAIAAGFDGVEVHAGNGYLLDQFAKDGANTRTDAYGGSIENRARLVVEVTAVVAAQVGAARTGIRLSPISMANDIATSDPQAQFDYLVDQLDTLKIAYIHVFEVPTQVAPFDYVGLRRRFSGSYIANQGYDRERAIAAIAEGRANLVAFGRPFIANPDLVERMKRGVPLAEVDPSTLYGGGAKGYTDYPVATAPAVAG
ncbi:alkene reductase [Sphingomonas psychrotolerans]|uniref:Alkene reductase n=1 Tax=Sphingomonas psychrotolerans TaxID=1327635 RepID=A0A2K8MHA5_9SPHN|nr:alkene reductase [Sphingomonas psychrotolerans]ATY32364.1 alkene reductase [Sphingomonas psychrotolerans]